MSKIINKCQYCGALIETTPSQNKQFCNKICYRMSQVNVKETKTCPICKKIFSVHKCKNAKYCSKTCKHVGQKSALSKPKIQKSCLSCSKLFLVSDSHKDQKFCSYDCFVNWQQTYSPRNNVCKVCNAFTKNKTYCSKECMAKDYSLILMKENNPNFKKEKIKRFNTGTSGAVRIKVLERDNYKCQECGMTDWDQKPSLLHLHHKVSFAESQDNSENNLITLCFVCHWVGRHQYELNQTLREIASQQNCRSRYLDSTTGD
jgi:hypothetical protein